jgi:hypothetical protein
MEQKIHYLAQRRLSLDRIVAYFNPLHPIRFMYRTGFPITLPHTPIASKLYRPSSFLTSTWYEILISPMRFSCAVSFSYIS